MTASSDIYFGDISNPKREWEFYRVLAAKVNGRLLGIPERHNHNIIAPDIYQHFQPTAQQITDSVAYIRSEIEQNVALSMPPNEEIVWVIKTPRTMLCLDIWYQVFPQATFINLVRDGRDVAFSLPEDCGTLERRFELWRKRLHRIWRYRQAGIPVYDFRYEDLVDAEKTRQFLLQLGITYQAEMADELRLSQGKGIKAFEGRFVEHFELFKYGYLPDVYSTSRLEKLKRLVSL